MALTISQPWQCFACHMDCAACHNDDHTVPYEQYDHPPAFPENDEDDEEISSVEVKPTIDEEDEDLPSAGYVSITLAPFGR